MNKVLEECFDEWVESNRELKIIWPPKGKLIDIPCGSGEGMRKTSNTRGEISLIEGKPIDYSRRPWVPMIGPDEFPGASEFIEKAIRAFYSEPEPLPITWPEGMSFHDAFFPDNPEPYNGPSRNHSTYVFPIIR